MINPALNDAQIAALRLLAVNPAGLVESGTDAGRVALGAL